MARRLWLGLIAAGGAVLSGKAGAGMQDNAEHQTSEPGNPQRKPLRIQPGQAAHVVLLGDSIFDNARYVEPGPDLIRQLRQALPASCKASLLAVDGSTTAGMAAQLTRLPKDASHLILSVGGNDALAHAGLLDAKEGSPIQTLNQLAQAVERFESAYAEVLRRCVATGLPLVACTIYNGNFPDPAYQRRAKVALTGFNDAILRKAALHQLTVIDLRRVCQQPADYANPIEPSVQGGEKISRKIAAVLKGDLRGLTLV